MWLSPHAHRNVSLSLPFFPGLGPKSIVELIKTMGELLLEETASRGTPLPSKMRQQKLYVLIIIKATAKQYFRPE